MAFRLELGYNMYFCRNWEYTDATVRKTHFDSYPGKCRLIWVETASPLGSSSSTASNIYSTLLQCYKTGYCSGIILMNATSSRLRLFLNNKEWDADYKKGHTPDCMLFAPCTDLQSSQIVIAAVGEIFSYRVRGNPCSDVTTLTRCLEILQRLPDIPFSSPSSWVYSFIAPF